jgi:DNA/RNA-binding domain of Phe-tRNA-synthetase-like protein
VLFWIRSALRLRLSEATSVCQAGVFLLKDLAGELVYRDDREVLTRNWVWRQCEKDKATERTVDIVIPIDVLGEVGSERASEIIQDLGHLITKYLGGSVLSAVLNKENLSCSIPPSTPSLSPTI